MFKYSFYFLIFFPIIVFSQSISFEPDLDTLKIGGGCTPPQIIASIKYDNPNQDSIFIYPGWNTIIYHNNAFFPSAKFIVETSGSNFEYDLCIRHENHISFSDTIVPFDTTFDFEAQEFYFKLMVFENGAAVDSLERFFIAEIGVGVEENTLHKNIPDDKYLLSCYPNPFNSFLTIEFKSPINENVQISIYNTLGQKIRNIFDGTNSRKTNRLTWNADKLSSGIYYILFNSNNHVFSKKVLLIK